MNGASLEGKSNEEIDRLLRRAVTLETGATELRMKLGKVMLVELGQNSRLDLSRMPEDVTIYPAHNGRGRKTTTLAYSDLADLHKAVCGALDGTVKGKPADAFGIPSTAYPVSKRLNMFVLKWPRNPADLEKGQ